jgi:hypothetical protein
MRTEPVVKYPNGQKLATKNNSAISTPTNRLYKTLRSLSSRDTVRKLTNVIVLITPATTSIKKAGARVKLRYMPTRLEKKKKLAAMRVACKSAWAVWSVGAFFKRYKERKAK